MTRDSHAPRAAVVVLAASQEATSAACAALLAAGIRALGCHSVPRAVALATSVLPALVLVLGCPDDADASSLASDLHRQLGCEALVVACDPALAAGADCVVPAPLDGADWPDRLAPVLDVLGGESVIADDEDGDSLGGEMAVAADGRVIEMDDCAQALLGSRIERCRPGAMPALGRSGQMRRLHPRHGRMVLSARAEPAPEHGPDARRLHLRDRTARHRQDALNHGRADILEQIARGAPLDTVLAAIVALVETQYPQWMCSVLRLSADGRRLQRGVAPRIPETINAAIDGAPIGPCAGSCGTAAWQRRLVVVADIDRDPLWADYKQLVIPHGLRACWSLPILAGDGRVLGTFATYAGVTGEPDAAALAMVKSCAHLASVALERELAQQELKRSRQLLESAQRVAHLGHWEHDVATGKFTWSPEVYALFGVDPGCFEPTFERILAQVHPQDRTLLRDKVTRPTPGSRELEYRICQPDGELRSVHERSEMTLDDDGRALREIGVVMDVTESRRAQQALVASEQRYRSLFEHHPDAVYALDAQGRYLSVNPAFEAMTGLSAEQALAGSFRTLVPEECLAKAQHMLERALAGESLHFEIDCINTRGERLNLEVTNLPIVVEDGIAGVYGIARDVTQRCLMEQRLRESESQLRFAGRMARLGSWLIDLRRGKVLRSEQARAIHDLDDEGDDDLRVALQRCHPDHVERVTRAIEACATEGAPFDEEFELTTAKGRRLWLRSIGEAVRDADGRIVHLQGAVQDITERKLAEARVQAVAARLATTLESITDAFVTMDREWRATYVNAEAERLLRQPRGALLGAVVWERFPALAESVFGARLREAMAGGDTVAFKAFFEPLSAWLDVRAYPSAEGLAIYFRDVTEQQRAEAQLKLLETCVARMNDIVMITEAEPVTGDGPRILFVNEAFERRTGYRRDEVIGKTPRLLQGPATQRNELDRIRAALLRWQPVRAELINYRKNGEPFWLELDIFPIADSSGWFTHWAAVERDIDERKRNERTLAQQAALLDNAQDAIVVRDMQHRVRYWNRSAERLYGWSREEVLDRAVDTLIYPDRQAFEKALRATLDDGDWSGELLQRRQNGSTVVCESRWTLVRDGDGQPQSVLAVHTDITERKRAEREIHELAFFDPLTRLPNRALLLDRLDQALAAHARSGHAGALLFIDMDNFKALNDTLGHDRGDQLLVQVGERLRAMLRDGDTVARLGGDEFVVMLESLAPDQDAAGRQAQAIGEKVLAALQQPFALDSNRYHTSASIGITLFRDRHDTSGELLKRADLAMYQAKAAGRNTVCFFDPHMQAALNQRAALEAQFREALRQRSFSLHFQPQCDREGRTLHAEALVRWNHPERGLVHPGDFTPLAEETGLIVELGQWVLERACEQLRAWTADPTLARIGLSVNVSARQFRHPDFVDQVLGALDRHGVSPTRLMLELTESLLLTDVEDVARKMTELRERGIGFSLDDFGTGYSSLAYLKRLPFDQIKIDQSFVKDVLTDGNDAAIARTIVALGQSLGLDVVAEGVETDAQRVRLAQYGCHAYQGYLFSHPLTATAFEDFMRRRAVPEA